MAPAEQRQHDLRQASDNRIRRLAAIALTLSFPEPHQLGPTHKESKMKHIFSFIIVPRLTLTTSALAMWSLSLWPRTLVTPPLAQSV